MQLQFFKINFHDFNFTSFRELVNFKDSSTQKLILKYLDDKQGKKICPLDNKSDIEQVQKKITSLNDSWKKEYRSFCNTFKSTQRKIYFLFNKKPMDFFQNF
jgi:ribosome biogenesis protein Tsr3